LYLSSIELLGFKSFPTKTKVQFADGITGVVGPNGCGKTNVLDAIRWVLGEQRTSVLRGGKMEDVIFSGTRELKPLGMAEVQLTVINNRNVLPTEYSSITITRRLHRSGESEYLLNNVACRLKDITELFADTGMGANAYSVIELEMVEAILSDKADQRRMLFEEAAGITKYKLRKRAALRKLEATEHDLLRLADILSEVTTQVNSLRRQMRKAEQYKTVEEKIRNGTLVLLKDSCRRISGDLRRVQEEKRISEIKLAQVAGEIDKWELMREDARSKVVELSSELQAFRNQIEQTSTRYHELNDELLVTGEKINAAESANESDLKEIESLRVKREILIEEQQQSLQKLSRMREELASLEQLAESKEKELAEMLDRLEEARRFSQDFQRDLFEVEGRKSLSEQSGKQLDEQIQELRGELDRLSAERESLAKEQEEVTRALSENEERLQQGQSAIESLKADLQSQDEAITAAREKTESTNASLTEARFEVKSIETHVNLQEQMIAHYEGYGSGVSALFADGVDLPGVVDTVANLIKPREDMVAPIELALGETSEFVLVADRDAAERAIEYLRSNDLGRATFLIKDRVPQQAAAESPSSLDGVDGFIGPALDLVEVAPENRAVAELVLGNVVIARDRHAAASMQENGGNGFRIVTLDGYHIRSESIYESGSESPTQLLGRESELERLREKLTVAQSEVERIETELQSLQSERSHLIEEKNLLSSRLDGAKREYTELQLTGTRLELHLSQISERAQVLTGQFDATEAKLGELLNRRRELEQDSTRLAGDTDCKRTALEAQEGKVEDIERQASVVGKEHEELRLRTIKLRTEVDSLESSIQRNAELIEELETTRQTRRDDRDQRAEEIERLKQRIEGLRAELETTGQSRETLRKQEMGLTEKQGTVSEKQTEYEELLKAARKTRDLEGEEHEKCVVRETENKARYEDVSRQLRESYGINVAEMTLPEPLSPETVAELEQELTQAKEKQVQLGMVNMLALEEYDREAKREEFLRKQIEDLTSAKDNLKTTISRINATARKMFVETFDQVRENFRKIFSELFQGGEADLRLEDDSDPLESPILISARPRGKRLLPISQLSGGEKALTAISLLFGIYLVKPSPFCILDEVDAPLDDANVGRFLKMVKTFAERTQFIIITHNKRTMEKCNRLYGVTMHRPGVSQIVSVDFEKVGKEMVPDTMTYQSAEDEAVADDINNGNGNSELGSELSDADVTLDEAEDIDEEVGVSVTQDEVDEDKE
jgi:chromosome segregation protein